MGKLSKFFLVMALLACVSISLNAQVVQSRVIKTEDGKFIIHKVEKGQTLYAISKLYSVTVEDIQKANPDIEEFGIRIDQNIRIPQKNVNKKEAKKSEIELSGDTIYHVVLKKETLYALSKRYDISIEELERLNPELQEGLKIGMRLKIPSIPKKEIESKAEEFQKPKSDSLILHEVKPKETLYSLSKLYNVSTDSIQMVNDGLQQGLQIGTTVRIPINNPVFVKESTTYVEDSLLYKQPSILYLDDTILIGIFLPFSVDSNTALQEMNKKAGILGVSKVSIDFYRGFGMAIDSLRMLGYNIDVHYFDTENDTLKCSNLMSDTIMARYDLFIGPLYQVNYACVAKKAKQYGVPIISPVKVSSRLLLGNKYVIKSYASSPSLVINMAEYVAANWADSNLILISGGAKKDVRYADIFQKHLNNAINDSIPIHKIWQASTSNYAQYIKKGEHNYVVLLSREEGFVSQSISVFYRMLRNNTEITVFGLDNWLRFKSIGMEDLQNLNVTIPTQKYTDYTDPRVINFVTNYREEYFTDPSEHVFSAFDVGMYFVKAMFESGGDWENYIGLHPNNGLITRFKFVKIAEDSGFENTGGFILEYDSYNLILKN